MSLFQQWLQPKTKNRNFITKFKQTNQITRTNYMTWVKKIYLFMVIIPYIGLDLYHL